MRACFVLSGFLALIFVGFHVNAKEQIQSTITETEGYACMGEDKSRKQTRHEAVTDAKRKAAESAKTYIKSETKVKDFQLENDIMDAYARANVSVIEMKELGWYKDELSGECFKVWIKAEVIPDKEAMARITEHKDLLDDPNVPLTVKLWTDRKKYQIGERIKIYLKGNKPFYARIVYQDAAGRLIQLMPNPFRSDNYFNGGVIYEIPSGRDRFELEVRPPFGEENITLYASTAQLGELDLAPAGGIYMVQTRSREVGMKTRGVKIIEKKGGPPGSPAEFSEAKIMVSTVK
jgi:hypothetical protein